MSAAHEKIVEKIQMDWSEFGMGRLFKNNIGSAWLGKPSGQCYDKKTNEKAMILAKFCKISYGLAVGSSDLIGFEIIKKKPIFCCVEVKTKFYPKISTEQKDWLNFVARTGGRAYVARETTDGYDLTKWEPEKEKKKKNVKITKDLKGKMHIK